MTTQLSVRNTDGTLRKKTRFFILRPRYNVLAPGETRQLAISTLQQWQHTIRYVSTRPRFSLQLGHL